MCKETFAAVQPKTIVDAFIADGSDFVDTFWKAKGKTALPKLFAAGAYTLATPADPGRFTRALNYLGLPALALPAGFSGAGLPLGVQLVARPFGEAALFAIGEAFQQVTDHHRRRPTAEPTHDARSHMSNI